MGCLISLFGIWAANQIGWIQISIARKEHGLNLAKTTPKIGTMVQMEERKHSAQPISLLVVVATIYNEGDLAVSDLKGDWNLTSSQQGFNRSGTIRLDHLGNTRPYKIETQFGDVGTWRDLSAGKDLAIHFDVEFRYTGIPEKDSQPYKAQYCYDHSQRDFVKRDLPADQSN